MSEGKNCDWKHLKYEPRDDPAFAVLAIEAENEKNVRDYSDQKNEDENGEQRCVQILLWTEDIYVLKN